MNTELWFNYENIDCMEHCKRIPSGSVDLIMTSPPYNLEKPYEIKEGKGRVEIETYVKSMEPLIAEFSRILEDTGSVCWQVGTCVEQANKKNKEGKIVTQTFPLDIYFYPLFLKHGFKLRNRIIWHFGRGLSAEHRFSGRYETIMWFSKSNDYKFNLDNVRIRAKYAKKNSEGVLVPNFKNPEDVWTIKKLHDDWEAMVWHITNVASKHPEKIQDHPCMFPVELAERCILALTDPLDVVYDPFAGVASTLVAALKNDRIAIGSELEQYYHELGTTRLIQLGKGELKTRPIWKEIHDPNSEKEK